MNLRDLLARAESHLPWSMWDTGERFGKPGEAFHISSDAPFPPGQDESCVTDELQPSVDIESQGAVKAGNAALIVAAVNSLPAMLDWQERVEKLLRDYPGSFSDADLVRWEREVGAFLRETADNKQEGT